MDETELTIGNGVAGMERHAAHGNGVLAVNQFLNQFISTNTQSTQMAAAASFALNHSSA